MAPSTRRTILFVDDEPDMRKTMRYWLEPLGYRVVDAVDGEHAWKLIEAQAPDLVMTDIEMPGLGGVELCERIKLTEKTSAIPVIMFTSHAETDAQLAGTKAGADAYMPKDIDLRVLHARIESVFSERSRQTKAAERELDSAKRRTLSQSVTTLAHYINNSVIAIHTTAGAIDPENREHVLKLQRVCQNESRKILAVLKALKTMAEEEELKTTIYVGKELMFDLETELARLAGAGKPPES